MTVTQRTQPIRVGDAVVYQPLSPTGLWYYPRHLRRVRGKVSRLVPVLDGVIAFVAWDRPGLPEAVCVRELHRASIAHDE